MKRFESLAADLFGLLFLLLGFAVAVETILRKVFNRSLQGVDELGGYILAIGAALSFAVALAARTHIRIDLIHDRLPRVLRLLLNVLALISITACSLALLWMAWFAMSESAALNATAQTPWATPLKYPQALWLAALGVFCVVCGFEILRLGRLVLGGRWDEIDRRYGPRGSKEELEEELQDIAARGAAAQVPIGGAGKEPRTP
jgi:TRAP-type C4-dicarboxylate transport system permease small subunit